MTDDTSLVMTRRRLARGAAWAAPVALVGLAAPAIAASYECGERTLTAAAPAAGSPLRAESTFTVPAGIRVVCFEMIGGAGGRAFTGSTSPAGSGARVTGTIPVTAGQVLTLVVGAGGVGYSGEPATGGQGYGDGGDAAEPAGTNYFNFGAAGGGGSAILDGTTPLAVAGGGGGNGNRFLRLTNGTSGQGIDWRSLVTGRGGNAGVTFTLRHGGSSEDQQYASSATRLLSPGGRAADNGAAGSGGAAGSIGPAATDITLSGFATAPGTAGGAGPRGDGADGVVIGAGTGMGNASQGYGTVSGAGGGGYGGGGSGTASEVFAQGDSGSAYAGQSSYMRNVGGGGAGGSYLAPSVVDGVIAEAGNDPSTRNTRNHGSIVLRY